MKKIWDPNIKSDPGASYPNCPSSGRPWIDTSLIISEIVENTV